MLENIRLAFQGIWSHKMRSFLTMLGIIIGIAAIIAIVSTIKGTNEIIKQNLIGSGKNSVDVKMQSGSWTLQITSSSDIPQGIPKVSDETMKEICDVKQVESATSYNERMISDGGLFYQSNSLSEVSIFGIDLDYFSVCDYIISTGRGFFQEDYDQYRTVAILDRTTCKGLFGDESPLGKTVEVSGTPFTVVGVAQEKHQKELKINSIEEYGNYYEESYGKIFITKAAWPIIYNYDEPENVTVKATSTDDMTQAGKQTAAILNATIQNSTDSSVKYVAEDLLGKATGLQQLASSQNIQLILIAGISLLVGGIGVMNIMLVSVTERTSEIGLKKAIGAKRRTILAQFLTEAAVLTSIGGMLGVASGVGAAYIVHRFTGSPMAVDVLASAIAVIFSMGIGILFGFLPSVQASNLDPIEALRRE